VQAASRAAGGAINDAEAGKLAKDAIKSDAQGKQKIFLIHML
jgi:hypothetical protein